MSTTPRTRPRPRFRDGIALCVIALLMGLALLPLVPTWWADAFNHFRMQMLLLTCVVGALLLLWVRRRYALLVLVPVLTHAVVMASSFSIMGEPSTHRLRVAHLNIGGCDHDAVEAWITSLQDVDAVFLLEVVPGDRFMRRAPEGWRLVLLNPEHGSRGVVAMIPADAPRPPGMVERFDALGDERNMATLDFGDVRVVHVHLARPWDQYRFQRGISEQLAGSARQHVDQSLVFVGDFNAAPWSHAVAPLRQAGMRPARSTLTGTWPAHMPALLRVPIDQALSDRDAHVMVGPDLGGDHRPILVTVE